MKHQRIIAAALALGLAGPLGGCAEVTKLWSTACAEQVKLPADVRAALDALDPHSIAGIYWANAKSACANGVPATTVSATWREEMWAAVKALAPSVIPWLIGLI